MVGLSPIWILDTIILLTLSVTPIAHGLISTPSFNVGVGRSSPFALRSTALDDETENIANRKIFVFTFIPVPHVYSICPFSIKLESFLRINKIEFESIYGTHMSSKGTVPFVKLDDVDTGTEISDSNIVLSILLHSLETHSESSLSLEQRAMTHCIIRMLEEHTQQIAFYYRYTLHMKDFLDKLDIAKRYRPGFAEFWFKVQPDQTRNKTTARGLLRHSDDQLWQFTYDDLQVLSDYLGDKRFFFGEHPSLVDCAVFGHLSQFLWIPIDYPQKIYLQTKCPNIVEFMNRFREEYWPDWKSLCSITIDHDAGETRATWKFDPSE